VLIGSNDPRFQNKIPLNPFGENKMSTNRRDFLKLAGAAAAAITSTRFQHQNSKTGALSPRQF